MKEYALYKGDQLLGIGTKKELAEKFKVQERTILFYGTKSYMKRRKNDNSRLLIQI